MTETKADDPEVEAVGEVVSCSRFVRLFCAVWGGLVLAGAMLAIVADPMTTLRTGVIPKIHPPDVDIKPAALLALATPPQALILGSSRVMKLNPACVHELTGLPTFNFALGNSIVEGWSAAFAFALDHAPIRRVLIGVDVEGFMPNGEVDPRLIASKYLGGYVKNRPPLTWNAATSTLLGAQTLHFSFSAARFYFFPPRDGAPKMSWGPDGFITYPIWEEEDRQGRLPRERLLEESRQILKGIWRGDFTALAPARVQLFRDLLISAHERSIEVDAFTPLLQPELRHVGPWAQIVARSAELDHLLQQLDRERLLHYHRFQEIEDFGGDRTAYFDGLHMMESNTSRLLVKIFGRTEGCGQQLPNALNQPVPSSN